MDNNTDIKVSVIIPVYNACDYIRPAMDSVLYQTLSEIEVICVDDGSTDNTLEVLKEYQARDSRVRIATETNAGPGLARNNGMKRARGKYIAFLDSDDFFEPNHLELLYELAERDELDIAIARYDIYNTHRSRFEPVVRTEHSDIYLPGKVTSKNEHHDCIFLSTVGAAWNKIFRRSFIEEKNLVFLQDVRIYEDVYFVATALSYAERIGKLQDILVHHRIHSEQARAKAFKKYYYQIPTVFRKIKEFLVQNGMYAPLSVSFLNLSVNRCYKIFNLLPSDSKEAFWNTFHNDYADILGWASHEASDFDSEELFNFAVNVQMYDYAAYKRRLEQGEWTNEGNVKQNIEIAKKKKKIRAFFRRIFPKKSKK